MFLVFGVSVWEWFDAGLSFHNRVLELVVLEVYDRADLEYSDIFEKEVFELKVQWADLADEYWFLFLFAF